MKKTNTRRRQRHATTPQVRTCEMITLWLCLVSVRVFKCRGRRVCAGRRIACARRHSLRVFALLLLLLLLLLLFLHRKISRLRLARVPNEGPKLLRW